MDDSLVTDPRVRNIPPNSETFRTISRILGRTPNRSEMDIFAFCWSRHLAAEQLAPVSEAEDGWKKHIIRWPHMKVGALDVGEGKAVVFSIKAGSRSANLNPQYGGAHGVTAALRDILCCGARPIGAMNALFFGGDSEQKISPLAHQMTQELGDYSNALGVPTLECSLFSDDAFEEHFLVNSMAVGATSSRRLNRGFSGKGDTVLYVTTRHNDPISDDSSSEHRSVDLQINECKQWACRDPYFGHLLAEGLIALFGARAVVGVWDLGHEGLACAAAEMGLSLETGVALYLEKLFVNERVPRIHDVLFRYFPDACLVSCFGKKLDEIRLILDKWELEAWEIGRLDEHEKLLIHGVDGKIEVEIPITHLSSCAFPLPAPGETETPVRDIHTIDFRHMMEEGHADPADATKRLLGSVNARSLADLNLCFDDTVRCNTLATNAITEANLLRLGGTSQAIAMTLVGQPRWSQLDPEWGPMVEVETAARRLSCVGARPLGMAACLNFDHAKNPEAAAQYDHCLSGLRKASNALSIPLVSMDVDFFGEIREKASYPTPVIGMIGLRDESIVFVENFFSAPELHVFLLGLPLGDLSGSEYASHVFGGIAGKINEPDLDSASRVHSLLVKAIGRGWIRHARASGVGGLALALAKSCMGPEEIGVRVSLPEGSDIHAQLFDELSALVIASVATHDRQDFAQFAQTQNVPCCEIGVTGGNRMVVSAGGQMHLSLSIEDLISCWKSGFPNSSC